MSAALAGFLACLPGRRELMHRNKMGLILLVLCLGRQDSSELGSDRAPVIKPVIKPEY